MGIIGKILKGENLALKNTFFWLGDGQPIVSEDSYSYIQDGYMSVGAVYECVDLIMKKILSCPVICYRVKNEQGYKKYENLLKSNNPIDVQKAMRMKEDVVEEYAPPEIKALIDKPNPKQTWDTFISTIATLYLITGNSLVYGNGSDQRIRAKKWSEIWALPFSPRDITIEAGGIYDPIRSYEVNYNSGESNLNFPAAQIAHIKTINPDFSPTAGQLFGMSPLRPYLSNLASERLGKDQLSKLIKNGMKFGMLTPKNKEDQLSSDQKDDLRDRLKSMFSSGEAMSRIFPGSVPMDFTSIGLGVDDLKLLELSKASREDIYRGYHVPSTYASNEASTFNNKASDGKQLIYNAVAPVGDAIIKSISNFICEPHNSGTTKYVLKLDYMSLPEMSVDMKEMAEWMAKSPQLSWNEKRFGMGYSEKTDDPEMDKVPSFMPKTSQNENSNSNKNE